MLLPFGNVLVDESQRSSCRSQFQY
jgi:hypothetical protein